MVSESRIMLDREILGELVRRAWVGWAKEQPNPKPHWLHPWEALDEPMQEVDRRIGETVAAWVLDAATRHIEEASKPATMNTALHEDGYDRARRRGLLEAVALLQELAPKQ